MACQIDSKLEPTSVKWYFKYNLLFIQENVIYTISAILFWPQCVHLLTQSINQAVNHTHSLSITVTDSYSIASHSLSHFLTHCLLLNSLRPRQNRRHFAGNIFKCIFLNENEWISLRISLKFVPKVRINNIPSLVQIMAWRRPGDKPLSEPMMVSLLTHICVTRPQVNYYSTTLALLLAHSPKITQEGNHSGVRATRPISFVLFLHPMYLKDQGICFHIKATRCLPYVVLWAQWLKKSWMDCSEVWHMCSEH